MLTESANGHIDKTVTEFHHLPRQTGRAESMISASLTSAAGTDISPGARQHVGDVRGVVDDPGHAVDILYPADSVTVPSPMTSVCWDTAMWAKSWSSGYLIETRMFD